jgi:hypothetical protein
MDKRMHLLALGQVGDAFSVTAYSMPDLAVVTANSCPRNAKLLQLDARFKEYAQFSYFVPDHDNGTLMYAISTSNSYRRLVQLIESSDDEQAIQFAKKNDIHLDVYYKLKLELARDIDTKSTVLARISVTLVDTGCVICARVHSGLRHGLLRICQAIVSTGAIDNDCVQGNRSSPEGGHQDGNSQALCLYSAGIDR